MQLPNGIMLQTGSFPPTAPPPDIDMPKLPPPSFEQQMEMKRRPFPRIVAAGIDEDPNQQLASSSPFDMKTAFFGPPLDTSTWVKGTHCVMQIDVWEDDGKPVQDCTTKAIIKQSTPQTKDGSSSDEQSSLSLAAV